MALVTQQRAAASSGMLHRANAQETVFLAKRLLDKRESSFVTGTSFQEGRWVQGSDLFPWERIPTLETPQGSGDQRQSRPFEKSGSSAISAPISNRPFPLLEHKY